MADNARIAYDYLTAQGLPGGAAVGVVGNLIAESGVQPNGPAGDGGTSHGIAQWHNSRWTDLKAWAAANGLDPLSLTTQLRYLVVEAKSMGVWQALTRVTDPYAASGVWVKQFERPKDQSQSAINARAARGISALGSGGGGGAPAADTTSTSSGGGSDPFPTFGPSWLPWNYPADVGNAVAAQQRGLLTGARAIVIEGAFLALALGLVAVGVVKATGADTKAKQAAKTAAGVIA